MKSAIAREKAIKRLKRAWKMALIEKSNPQWRDLNEELTWLDSGPDPDRGRNDERLRRHHRRSGGGRNPEWGLSPD